MDERGLDSPRTAPRSQGPAADVGECAAAPGPVVQDRHDARAEEVLGMKEYVGQDETLLETVDALLELEKTWS